LLLMSLLEWNVDVCGRKSLSTLENVIHRAVTLCIVMLIHLSRNAIVLLDRCRWSMMNMWTSHRFQSLITQGLLALSTWRRLAMHRPSLVNP
jgi:hypothetical protein